MRDTHRFRRACPPAWKGQDIGSHLSWAPPVRVGAQGRDPRFAPDDESSGVDRPGTYDRAWISTSPPRPSSLRLCVTGRSPAGDCSTTSSPASSGTTPDLNAVVALDVDRARAAADSADAAMVNGHASGRLHGLPMTVKDVWETEGLVTTSGAPELRTHVPRTDALAVGRLQAASAVTFGKTQHAAVRGRLPDVSTTSMASPTTHRTPLAPPAGRRVAPPSRSGRGSLPLELGSDIGGSIRNPAHHNGVLRAEAVVGCGAQPRPHPGTTGQPCRARRQLQRPLARSLGDLGMVLACFPSGGCDPRQPFGPLVRGWQQVAETAAGAASRYRTGEIVGL